MQIGTKVKLKVDNAPWWNKGDLCKIHDVHYCKRCGAVEYTLVHLEHCDLRAFEIDEFEECTCMPL